MPQLHIKNAPNVYLLFFLLALSFFLSACSSFIGRAPERPPDPREIEARDLLDKIYKVNETLRTFKGIGRLNLSKRGTIRGGRVAWIGSYDGKLRIEVLGISGQPIASLASDGHWVYLSSQVKRRFHKARINDASLKNFISIPVKTSDVIALITGRVPVREYSTAMVRKNDTGDGYVLILKKRWGNVIEKIYMDNQKESVHKIEIFDVTGSLLYRVTLENIRIIQDYRIAMRLVMSNDTGADFKLTIERYWPNIPVSTSMFELVPPE
ncbi:MAG: DUF4292 domain-containing protein [Deltaproteobacteria bacterium]|nr:DUF4292 domain-containing protein [Deltaproteobacteria bacterium]